MSDDCLVDYDPLVLLLPVGLLLTPLTLVSVDYLSLFVLFILDNLLVTLPTLVYVVPLIYDCLILLFLITPLFVTTLASIDLLMVYDLLVFLLPLYFMILELLNGIVIFYVRLVLLLLRLPMVIIDFLLVILARGTTEVLPFYNCLVHESLMLPTFFIESVLPTVTIILLPYAMFHQMLVLNRIAISISKDPFIINTSIFDFLTIIIFTSIAHFELRFAFIICIKGHMNNIRKNRRTLNLKSNVLEHHIGNSFNEKQYSTIYLYKFVGSKFLYVPYFIDKYYFLLTDLSRIVSRLTIYPNAYAILFLPHLFLFI